MITRETVTEFFNRIKGGLKRVGKEPITQGVGFTISPDGTRAYAAVRDGFTVQDKPQRKRHQRTHTFHDVGSFAGWLLNKGADPKETEVLVSGAKFTAALTPGDVGGDYVTCELQQHPRFARWQKLFNTPVTQAVLLKHLYSVGEDTDTAKVKIGGKVEEAGPLAEKWAGELASFSVDKDTQATQKINRFGMIELEGGNNKTTTTSKLPSVFSITVPIFRGIEAPADLTLGSNLKPAEYTIQVRLYISTKDGVKFTLEAPDLAIVLDKATEDAVAHLSRDLKASGGDWLVGRGQMKLTETFDRDAGAQGCIAVEAEE